MYTRISICGTPKDCAPLSSRICDFVRSVNSYIDGMRESISSGKYSAEPPINVFKMRMGASLIRDTRLAVFLGGTYGADDFRKAYELIEDCDFRCTYVYFHNIDESALDDEALAVYNCICREYGHLCCMFSNVASLLSQMLMLLQDATRGAGLDIYESDGAMYLGKEQVLSAEELECVRENNAQYSGYFYGKLADYYRATEGLLYSEDYCKQAIEVLRESVRAGDKSNRELLLAAYMRLLSLREVKRSFDPCDDIVHEAYSLTCDLVNENPLAYRGLQALTAKHIGDFYSRKRKYEVADKYYAKAEELALQVIEEHIDGGVEWCETLARVYRSMAENRYSDDEGSDAVSYALKIIDMYERLTEKRRIIYAPSLAEAYEFLGGVYCDYESFGSAHMYYIKALELRGELAQGDPMLYGSDFTVTCHYLANYYEGEKKYGELAEICGFAVEMTEHLAEKNPRRYNSRLADACGQLVSAYKLLGEAAEDREVEDAYRKLISIEDKLYGSEPKTYAPLLAEHYCEYADRTGNEECYRYALRFAGESITEPSSELIYERLKDKYSS